MRTKFLMVFVAAFSLSSVALASAKVDAFDVQALRLKNGTTPYQAISTWYKSAVSVPFSEMDGKAMAGRCFDVGTPTTPIVTAVVATRKLTGPDDGPAFPKVLERKVAVLTDTGSLDRASLLNYMITNWSDWATMIANDSDPLLYDQNNLMGEVRRFNNYLLTVVDLDKDLTCGTNQLPLCKKGQVVKKGTAIFACYFYQELN